MNRERLQKVFQNYIQKFEIINDDDHNENFKWEAAANFRTLMDTKSDKFCENIKEAVRQTSVLIDGKQRYCFSALGKCAESHEDEVKILFDALFAEDGGALVVRQAKILTFIKNANELVSRIYTDNSMYMNDQRSAIAYLFLYDPENNYLYKASEAKDFAACIGFYGDWGSGVEFHLDVYYRMCDRLVEEIKKNQELLDKHNERYTSKYGNRVLHPDINYHILAFDLIYGAPDYRYNFYEGMKFPPITSDDYKKAKIALELYNKLQDARKKVDQLDEAESYFNRVFCVGKIVKDKFNNEGIITKVEQKVIYVQFPKQDKTRAYIPIDAYINKMLSTDDPELEYMIMQHRETLKIRNVIRNNLKNAEADLAPYKDYLEQ